MSGFIRGCLLAISLLGLIACGGGSSNGSRGDTPSAADGARNAAAPVVQTGVLTEVVVAGLPYRTETQSGVTNALGEYSFLPGETVTFFIGEIPIGFPVRAQERLRILDLFPDIRLYRTFTDLKLLFSLIPSAPQRLAFNRFANTLFFLEAFDRDSDLSNGVEFVPGVQDLFSGIQMDLEVGIYLFSRHYPPLIYFRNRAYALDLVDNGAVRDTGMVLDEYYAAVGLVSGFYLPVAEFKDFQFDQIIDEATDYEYDDPGNIVRVFREYDFDPLTAVTWLATYDPFGNILSKALETVPIRVDDEFTEFEYDGAGNLIEIREDLDNDGVFERIQTREYSFGDLNYEIRVSDSRSDDNAADSEFTLAYQLDESGRLTELRRDDQLLASFTYFEGGKLESGSLFQDGGPDPVRVREFNQASQLVRYSFDIAERGEGQWEFFYNSRGNILRKRFQGTSEDFLILRLLVEYEYNLSGNLVLYTVDFEEDGTVDRSREYVYDNDDRLIREVWFEHFAGEVQETAAQRVAVFEVAYAYNEAGLLATKTRTDLLSGAPLLPATSSVAFNYGYDERGNLVSVQRDDLADGSVEFEKAFVLSRINWRAALQWIAQKSIYSKLPYERLPRKKELLRRLEEFIRLRDLEDTLVDDLQRDLLEIQILEEFDDERLFLRTFAGVEVVSINCANPFTVEFFANGEAIIRDLSDLTLDPVILTWFVTRKGIVTLEVGGVEFRFKVRRYRNKTLLLGQPSAEFVFELRPLDLHPLPYACTFRGRRARDFVELD